MEDCQEEGCRRRRRSGAGLRQWFLGLGCSAARAEIGYHGRVTAGAESLIGWRLPEMFREVQGGRSSRNHAQFPSTQELRMQHYTTHMGPGLEAPRARLRRRCKRLTRIASDHSASLPLSPGFAALLGDGALDSSLASAIFLRTADMKHVA